ncbi:auxin-responsive protein IAA32-like [Chenopodium quinoa]|uniref:Auxin-responsive protein n=1 Tax=Chenopodium quinoa TaxID=63459 RepID=A0A803LJH1_CHEQI|nr:auxin-responsive protein IAA32-like [Chenopodium quinoa]
MESNMAGFLLNASTLDLGLSLNTLHTQACHHADQSNQRLQMDSTIVPGGYNNDPMQWSYPSYLVRLKSPNCSESNPDNSIQELEGVQSKERWTYVKVNMDGVIVGRKICLVDHAGYADLALQLENMFGGLTAYGLRLFQRGSEFMLFYKDREEKWRSAGDVPWKEFVDCAKRLRILRKNKVLLS